MAKADSEGGNLAGDHPQRLDRRFDGRGIPRAIRDEEPIDLPTGERLLKDRGRGVVGHDSNDAAPLPEISIDVALRAAIESHHDERPIGIGTL